MSQEEDLGAKLGKAMCCDETPKAIKVFSKDVKGGKSFWIPKSVLHDDSEVYNKTTEGCQGELIVATWWAEKEGLA